MSIDLQEKGKVNWPLIALLAIILATFFACVFNSPKNDAVFGSKNDAAFSSKPTVVPPGPPPVIPPDVKLGFVDMSYNSFVADLTITNPNDFPVADTEVVCDVTAASGTRVGGYRERIYEIIPANGKKTVKRHKFGYWPNQGKSVSCFGNQAVRR